VHKDPDWQTSTYERIPQVSKKQPYKWFVIKHPYAIIEPHAMVVKYGDTLVAVSAVL
jgi:hypothetical protein